MFGGGKRRRGAENKGASLSVQERPEENLFEPELTSEEKLELQEQAVQAEIWIDERYTALIKDFYSTGIKRYLRQVPLSSTELAIDPSRLADPDENFLQLFVDKVAGSFIGQEFDRAIEKGAYRDLLEVRNRDGIINIVIGMLDRQVRAEVLSDYVIRSIRKSTQSSLEEQSQPLIGIIESLDIEFPPRQDVAEKYSNQIAADYALALISEQDVRAELYDKLLDVLGEPTHPVSRQIALIASLVFRFKRGGLPSQHELGGLVDISLEIKETKAAKDHLESGGKFEQLSLISEDLTHYIYTLSAVTDNPNATTALTHIGVATLYESLDPAHKDESLPAVADHEVLDSLEDLEGADLSLTHPDILPDATSPTNIPAMPSIKLKDISAEDARKKLGLHTPRTRTTVTTAAIVGVATAGGIIFSASSSAAASHRPVVVSEQPNDSTSEGLKFDTNMIQLTPSSETRSATPNTAAQTTQLAAEQQPQSAAATEKEASPSSRRGRHAAEPLPESTPQSSRSEAIAFAVPDTATLPDTSKSQGQNILNVNQASASSTVQESTSSIASSRSSSDTSAPERSVENTPAPERSSDNNPAPERSTDNLLANPEQSTATSPQSVESLQSNADISSRAENSAQSSRAEQASKPQETITIVPLEAQGTEGGGMRLAVTSPRESAVTPGAQPAAESSDNSRGGIRLRLPSFTRDRTPDAASQQRQQIQQTREQQYNNFLNSLEFAASQNKTIEQNARELEADFQTTFGQSRDVPQEIETSIGMLSNHYNQFSEEPKMRIALATAALSYPQVLNDMPANVQELWNMPTVDPATGQPFDAAAGPALEKLLESRVQGLTNGLFGADQSYSAEQKAAIVRLIFVAEAHNYSSEYVNTVVAQFAPPPPPPVEVAPTPEAAPAGISAEQEALNRLIETAPDGVTQRTYYAFRFFLSQGFTAEQATGIIGNLLVESAGTMHPNVRQSDQGNLDIDLDPFVQHGDKGPGRGIAQWGAWKKDSNGNYVRNAEGKRIVAGRFEALVAFAESQGKPWNDFDVQLNFIMHEFAHGESSAAGKIREAITASDAAYAFMRWYERPADKSIEASNTRLERSQPYLDGFLQTRDIINQERAAAAAAEAARIAAEQAAAAEAARIEAERAAAMPNGQEIEAQLKADAPKTERAPNGESGHLRDDQLEVLGGPWGGLRLHPDAAAKFREMSAAFEATFGRPIEVNNTYRDIEGQVAARDKYGIGAAPVGTSNHGWGLALDLGKGSAERTEGTAEHNWLKTHGIEYGWINPLWAQDYDKSNGIHEPWHWEFAGSAGQY